MAPKTTTMRKLRGLLGLAAAEAFLIAAILNAGAGDWLRMLCDLVGIGVAGYIVTLTPARRQGPGGGAAIAPLYRGAAASARKSVSVSAAR
jgi:hypothetical protein